MTTGRLPRQWFGPAALATLGVLLVVLGVVGATMLVKTLNTAQPPAITQMGQPFEVSDGVSVQIDPPKHFKPSTLATNAAGAIRFVSVTVTIVNNSGENLDPSEFTLAASADGMALSEVRDPPKGVVGAPRTTIVPGGSVSYKTAFGLRYNHRMQLQVDARLPDRDPAIFVGQA